jgi:hypothetical protein
LTFPFQDWHGIGRKLATADRHTICIVRRRSRQMFARLCVAPALLDPPASPLGNRCAQWNRGRQWNARRTQWRGGAKLKAPLASCILSSNKRTKTIARVGGIAIRPPVGMQSGTNPLHAVIPVYQGNHGQRRHRQSLPLPTRAFATLQEGQCRLTLIMSSSARRVVGDRMSGPIPAPLAGARDRANDGSTTPPSSRWPCWKTRCST